MLGRCSKTFYVDKADSPTGTDIICGGGVNGTTDMAQFPFTTKGLSPYTPYDQWRDTCVKRMPKCSPCNDATCCSGDSQIDKETVEVNVTAYPEKELSFLPGIPIGHRYASLPNPSPAALPSASRTNFLRPLTKPPVSFMCPWAFGSRRYGFCFVPYPSASFYAGRCMPWITGVCPPAPALCSAMRPCSLSSGKALELSICPPHPSVQVLPALLAALLMHFGRSLASRRTRLQLRA